MKHLLLLLKGYLNMSKVFEKNIYEYIGDYINGQLVFDIGANVGLITTILINKGANVVAIEPQFEKTKSDIFKKCISVKNICLSDHNGFVEFHKCKNYHTISTCFEEWKYGYFEKTAQWEPPVKIECITIDYLIKEFGVPKYIKVDVEGYENIVFNGLSQPIDLISFEYTGGYKKVFYDSLNNLYSLGVKKFICFEKNKEYENGKMIRMWFLVNEFYNLEECKKYFNSLQKFKQGDVLVITGNDNL